MIIAALMENLRDWMRIFFNLIKVFNKFEVLKISQMDAHPLFNQRN